MIFTSLDIITCAALCFTIGLYTGAFIQRRRDVKEIAEEKVVLSRLFRAFIKLTGKKEGEVK